jgi:hypothetical protein
MESNQYYNRVTEHNTSLANQGVIYIVFALSFRLEEGGRINKAVTDTTTDTRSSIHFSWLHKLATLIQPSDRTSPLVVASLVGGGGGGIIWAAICNRTVSITSASMINAPRRTSDRSNLDVGRHGPSRRP